VPEHDAEKVYRILDANLNRLREALRVIEEYFRLYDTHVSLAGELKEMRHSLRCIEKGLGRSALLYHRDTSSDPFACGTRPEELDRCDVGDILAANLRRGQEASRVLEEYVKIADAADCAATAKTIRFKLYALEKTVAGIQTHDS
jgi:thiamine-phosphate pyrophosphorylase